MNPLDEREVRLANRAAVVGGAGFLALYATTGFSESAYVVGAAIGLAMAGLLGLAARSGRRMLTGLAALAVGLGPWGAAWLLGAPFLLLAGWLLFRARARDGPEQVESHLPGSEASTDDAMPAVTRRRRSRGPAAPPAGASRRQPAANKRYTPPSGR